MSYATIDDLTARYGTEVLELADRNRDSLPDVDFINAAFSDVDAEIDSFLAARYALPLSSTPTVVVRIACALARERMALANGARMDATDPIKAEADNARSLLKAIGSGRASIGLQQPSAQTGSVEMQSGGRVWDRNQSAGYI